MKIINVVALGLFNLIKDLVFFPKDLVFFPCLLSPFKGGWGGEGLNLLKGAGHWKVDYAPTHFVLDAFFFSFLQGEGSSVGGGPERTGK